MPHKQVEPANPRNILLENILLVMSEETFGKRKAAKIVGGEDRLEDLIAAGEIEASKGVNVQNSKWKCNAAQVLVHCRNMRGKG